MADQHQGAARKVWYATFDGGGPLDGKRETLTSLAREVLVPCAPTHDGFRGVHRYLATRHDASTGALILTYVGEQWEPDVQP